MPVPYPVGNSFSSVSKTHDSSGILEPGQDGAGFGRLDSPLTNEQINNILEGSKLNLYVAGTLSYRQPSGVKCRRRFMFHVGGPSFVESIKEFQASKSGYTTWLETPAYNDVNKACR
jgi:hypothetical protein